MGVGGQIEEEIPQEMAETIIGAAMVGEIKGHLRGVLSPKINNDVRK